MRANLIVKGRIATKIYWAYRTTRAAVCVLRLGAVKEDSIRLTLNPFWDNTHRCVRIKTAVKDS